MRVLIIVIVWKFYDNIEIFLRVSTEMPLWVVSATKSPTQTSWQ